MSNLKITVMIDEYPELNTEELTSKISTALTGLGLAVLGEKCQPGSLRLQVSPELHWTNIMGRVVQLDLQGEVGPCGQFEPWNLFHINDRRMRGEGRLPMADLYDRLDPAFFEESLSEILSPYIPF